MSFHYREGTHQTRTVHDIGTEAHSRRQLFGVNMANWKNLPDMDSNDLAPSPGDVSDLATDNITVNAPAAAAAAEAAADVTLHHDYLSGDRDVFLVEENERLCRQMQQQERRHQQKIQQQALQIKQQALQIKQQEQTIEQLKQQIKNLQKLNDNAHHSL